MVLSARSTVSPDTIGPFKSALLRLRLRLLPHPRDPTTTPAPLHLRPPAGSRLTWGQNRTEPGAVVPVVRAAVVAEAVRHSAALHKAAPTTAARHTVRARTRPSRVSLCGLFISTTPVPSPLPRIPSHIIQPISVRSIGSNRCRPSFISQAVDRQLSADLIRSPRIQLP